MNWIDNTVKEANIKLGFKEPSVPHKNDKEAWKDIWENGATIECAWDPENNRGTNRKENWNIVGDAGGAFMHPDGKVQWRYPPVEK